MSSKLRRFLSLALVFVMVLSTMPVNAYATETVVNEWNYNEGISVVSRDDENADVDVPTEAPTETPAETPVVTEAPTEEPVVTEAPTEEPVVTETPTEEPVVTETPTEEPVVTEAPTAKPVVATFDGKNYHSLTEAFKAALVSGGTIKLLADVDETVRLDTDEVTEAQEITLDLGGKRWNCGPGSRLNAMDLTIKNGKVGTYGGSDVLFFGGHTDVKSTLTIDVDVFNAELRVNDMAPTDDEINSLLSVQTKSVEKVNVTKAFIKGGIFEDAVMVQKGAYLIIEGGTFKKGIDAEDGANVVDERKPTSEATPEPVKVVTSGKISALNGAVLTRSGVTTTISAAKRDVTKVGFKVTVPDGLNEWGVMVLPPVGEAKSVGEGHQKNADGSVYKVYEYTFAEGEESVTYKIDWNNNGTWDVLVVLMPFYTDDASVVSDPRVAAIDGRGEYTTLQAAIDAARPGEIVTLLQDVNESVTVSKSITIEFADKTFNGAGARARSSGNTVTLDGLTITAGACYELVFNANGTCTVEEWDYKIETKDELSYFATQVNGGTTFKDKIVTLDADIDLREVDTNGERVSFTPIGDKAVFEGTFDGCGHTISNLYQNGWALGYEWGKYGSVGLFGEIKDATIKNLTLEGAECLVEGGDVGGITGSATGDCTFENITIKNSTFATYNNGCGSIIAWSGAGSYTFKDITIASDVTLAGLWGSFDSSIGGIVGQGEPGATYNFENVDIACRIDAYNDCTASYDYYLYRMCGMIIGRLEKTTTIDGTNYPDMSQYNITCDDVKVTYGDWMNYHYCEPTPSNMNNGRGMRVERGYAYDGLPADYDHSNCTTNHNTLIPFDQLFGGAQYGVKGLPTYKGVTVNYPADEVLATVTFEGLGGTVVENYPSDNLKTLQDLVDYYLVINSLTGADDTPVITLYGDVTGSINFTGTDSWGNINEGADWTLELNGYTLNGKVTVDSDSTLTVQDSVGGGKIGGDIVGIDNSGTVTVKSGTVYGEEYGIYNNGEAIANVEGGLITSEAVNNIVVSASIWNESGVVNVTGGKIEAATADTAIYNEDGTVKVTGGEVYGNENDAGIVNEEDGTAVLSGGTFDRDYTIGYPGVTIDDGYRAYPNVDGITWTVKEWDYKISTKEDLIYFASLVNAGNTFEGKTVKLAADIDLYEVDADGERVSFTPIGDKAVFEGTFDGQGHTISNLYQNGWALGYEWGVYGSVGLFGEIKDATIMNLTIDGAECLVEGGDVGGITGSATGNCTFENITITDSTFATYNNGCGGIIAWSGAGSYTFKNIKIESDVTLAGLWGSFDSSIGGVVGQGEPGATYNFENVDIACRLDVYNDCTASYDYYIYRMCGMIIGRLAKTTTIDGTNYPDMSQYNITCTKVTVTYGTWMDYHYCEPTPGYNNGRGMRVETGYSYSGLPADYDHSQCTTNHNTWIPFDQLFGGAQYGVKGLPTYEGVTVIYPRRVAQIGETKYPTIYDAVNAAQDDDTIKVLVSHAVDCSQVTNKAFGGQNTSVLWNITKDITLDLNDKTVTLTNTIPTNGTTLAGIVYAANGADVVVTGDGAIVQKDSDGWADLFFADNGSTLTVKNGTYTCDPDEGVLSNYMLYAAGGLLTIEGGTYTHTTPGYKYIFNVANGKQDIVITGGTFTKDPATESEVTIPEGYTSVDNGNGTWTVKPLITVTFDDQKMILGDELPEFTYTVEENIDDEYMLVIETPEVTVNGVGEYEITANAYVFGNDKYAVEVVPGTLTVVAAVAEVNGVKYGSIQAAFDAAQDGDTVTLLTDIKLTDDDIVMAGSYKVMANVDGKNITLDMAGKKITVEYEGGPHLVAVIRVADGAGLTVTGNGTIDVTGENSVNVAYMFWKAGTTGYLTVENGTYHMADTADSMVYTNGHEIVTIKGGTWTLNTVNTRGDNDEPWIFNVQGAGDHSIVITGGSYNADINRQKWSNEAVVAKDHYVIEENGYWTVYEGAVAYVHEGMLTGPYYAPKDVGYATFEAAVAAANAKNDTPITLLKDAEVTGNVVLNEGITLNCGDYSVVLATAEATLTAPEGLIVTTNVVGGTVVYEGGVYKVQVKTQATLTFEGWGGTVEVNYPSDQAKTLQDLVDYYLVINSLTGADYTPVITLYGDVAGFINFTGTDSWGVVNEGADWTLELNGHTLNGMVTVDSDSTLTVQDSVGDGKIGGDIVGIDNYGTVTVKGGTVSGEAYGIYNNELETGVATANIEGGLITSEAVNNIVVSASIWNESGVVNVTGGKIAAGNADTAIYNEDGTVTVTGGEVYGNGNDAGIVNDEDGTAVLSGGTFDRDYTNGYYNVTIADGYKSVDNGNGTWTVKPLITVTFDDITVVDGNELPKFTWKSNFTEVAGDSMMLIVENPTFDEHMVDGKLPVDEYEITANAYVFMNDDYAVEVVPGTLTVVAAVAEVNGVKYGSIQDAVEAANDGETIVLLKDINIADVEYVTLDDSYNSVAVIEDKSVTIDMAGYKIYGEYSDSTLLVGVFTTDNNGHLTLVNGSINVQSSDHDEYTSNVYALICNYEPGCSIDIQSGSYKLDKAHDCLIYSGCTENGTQGVTVSGGNYYLGNVGDGQNGKPWIFNVLGGNEAHTTVTGGTYNANVGDQYWEYEVYIPETHGVRYDGDAAGYETWTVIEVMIALKGVEVSFDAETELWLKFSISDKFLNDEGAYAVMTEEANAVVEDGQITTFTSADIKAMTKDKNGRYVFAQGIAAGEMTGDVTVKFYDGEDNVLYISDYADPSGVKTEVVRTVLDYAELALTQGNDGQKALNTAALTYGGYAQLFFKVDTENPAYNLLTELHLEQLDINPVTPESINKWLTVTGPDEFGVTYKSQQVFADSAVYMRTYFILGDGEDIANYTFVVTGPDRRQTITPTVIDGVYAVDVTSIAPAYWDNDYTITVTDTRSSETYVVTASVLAWAQRGIIASKDQDQINWLKSMVLYNKAANSFFGK